MQFSSQAAGEQFCSPAETGKRSLKLVGNGKRWHAKAGQMVLPPSARSRFAGELGKSQVKWKTQPPLEKKVQDQSQLLDLLPLVLPWGHFPEVKGPALGFKGQRGGGRVSEPLAGGWGFSTQLLFGVADRNPAPAEPQHPPASPRLSGRSPSRAVSRTADFCCRSVPCPWQAAVINLRSTDPPSQFLGCISASFSFELFFQSLLSP